MSEIEKLHLQAREKAIQENERKKISFLDKLKKNIEIEISKLAESSNFSANSILASEKLLLDDNTAYNSVPYILRIGELTPIIKDIETNEIVIPAFLPFAHSNATSFLIDKNNDEVIQNTFQMFALRLMLSLPVSLAKFYFVDTFSFGRKFNLINRLSPKINYTIIDDVSKINSIITELEQTIRNTNRDCLTTYSWLDEYNKNAGQLATPYKFVFISNFPLGFNQEATEKLFNIINNLNAAKAGIFIFYSIDKNMSLPYRFDYSKFTNISTYIYPNNEIDYEIENMAVFDKKFNDTFNITLRGKLPENIEQIIEAINEKANNDKQSIVSLDGDMKNLMEDGKYWKASTKTGFKVPIGFISSTEKMYFEFEGDSIDYFAMIGGRPGYGKTVLLHNIICNASIIYSPIELNFYLIDCTNGTGFTQYDKLPHATFVSITSEREYTVSALKNLIEEMKKRADLFTQAKKAYNISISKIEEYRDATKKVLPRIVVIIDEFQVLLELGDKISRTAKSYMEKIIREGRKYGINMILCTQSFLRLDLDTNLITLRIAFNLSASDSDKILGNDGALSLTKKGEAIMNNQSGNKNTNIRFQGAFTNKMTEYVNFSNSKLKDLNNYSQKRFVFDGKFDNELSSNDYIKNLITGQSKINDDFCNIYIGIPLFIRPEHIYYKIRMNQGSNVLLVGHDTDSAMTITALSNYQLIKQSSENSKFYIANFFSSDSSYSNYFSKMFNPFPNLQVVRGRDISKIVDEIEHELSIRIENDKNNISNKERGRIFLSLIYIQNAKELKKEGYNQSLITKKLIKIIKDGPDLGIHTLVYARTYKGLTEIFDIAFVLNEFENKIALFEGDSMSILTEQTTSSPKDNGFGLLQTDDEIATYNPDPFAFYSNLKTDIKNEDTKFLSQIFSVKNDSK